MAGQTRGMCSRFADTQILAAINELADQEDLTVTIGAGSSIEAGFPDWSKLVRDLLRDVASSHGLAVGDVDEFVNWTVSESLVAAGAVAKNELGDAFGAKLHAALYQTQRTPPPGETARAVSQWFSTRDLERTCLSTTNYDLVLERALAAAFGRPSVATRVSPLTRPSSLPYVLHLHGVVHPRGKTDGDVVLSEQDYHLMQEPGTWQERFFDRRLRESTCVFLGASLTDPNLLRYLYRSASERTHRAVFARQQHADLYDRAPVAVQRAREATARRRWNAAGVEAVLLDYYSQSAQLVQEISHRRTCAKRGRRYRPLPDRLRGWHRKISTTALTRSATDFSRVQDELHEMQRDVLEGVRLDLKTSGHRLAAEEKLGLSLWAYDPATESLTNWASADRVWRDHATLEPVPIDWRSDFVAVNAFCSGSMVSQSTERHTATRWNHVVGIPLYVEGDSVGGLPVGVATLASTLPSPQSLLARGLWAVRSKSLPTIERVLSNVLDPYTD